MELSKLPCWKHLSDEAYQKRVAGLANEIEEEAAAERQRAGKPVLGVAAILTQDPQYRPACLDRSPCPFFLAASESMWRTLYEAYAWFVAEFRSAAEKLRAGDRAAPFPPGAAFRRRVIASRPLASQTSRRSLMVKAEVCPETRF